MLSAIQEENTDSMQKIHELKKQGKGRICNKKRNSTQMTNHKNPPGCSFGGLHTRENKKDNMLNISASNRLSDKGEYERFPRTAPST